LNPSAETVAASTSVQILAYPLPYIPSPGTILSNSSGSLPAGYLACDGSAISRSTYTVLFAMIGTFYGAGDGSTTFNVPSLSVGTGSAFSYIIRYSNPVDAVPSMLNLQILPFPLDYIPAPGTVLRNTENYLPNGYLACDGSAVLRGEYTLLFNMIGEHYGPGDGSTTFNLPSLSNGTGAPYTYIIAYTDQIIPCVTIAPNLNVSGITLPLNGLNLS
jgi:microcystin-dependent protein